MKSVATIMIAALVCSSCYVRPSQAATCRGVLDLTGIRDPRAREDASHTIIQFIALDEKVVLTKSDTYHLYIKALGNSCREFARSFTASDVSVFRGLTYNEIEGKPRR